MTSIPEEWLLRACDALTRRSTDEMLAEVSGLLGAMGLEPHAGPPEGAWVAVSHRGRSLAFARSSDGEPAATKALVATLLRACLTRAAEQDEHRSLRERTEMLSAASFEGILVHVDGVVVDANQRLAEILGYESVSEVLGPHTMPRCVSPEDLPRVAQKMSGGYEGEYVITGVRKDRSTFRAEMLSKQGHLGDRPVRVVAVRDVTERERTHALLRESEAHVRELAEQAFDAFVVSRDGVILEARGAFQAIFDIAPEALVGRSILELIAPSSRAAVTEILAERRVGSYETMMVTRTGAPVPIEVCAVLSTQDGRPIRVAGLRDLREAKRLLAERQKLQEHVEQSQRLESLGVLAGGIAHDFNNLLVGIFGNADLLLMTLRDEGERELARAILAAGHRAADLTRQMLAYAGPRKLARREPVDLGELCRELRVLLDASLSKKARVTLSIEPGSVVLGDRATLTQVLMNLLTNASDALGDEPGDVAVRMRRIREPDARWDEALGATLRPGDWVLIEVADTGQGMDAATRKRAFEPFFSTKQKGHGLGLAACLGIVSSHGGALLVESEVGEGSRFSALLPASEHDAEVARRAPAAGGGGCYKVLVVDDEALVRSQLRRSLELRGHTVEEAEDGTSGLAAVERHAPDVVILDLTMPDLDGADVVRRIRSSGSDVPIVLCSGHSSIDIERRLEHASFQGFLRKPYSVAELLDAIERAVRSVERGPR